MRIENSFIPVQGVGETTERRLWEQGVTHWEKFDPGVNGVGETTAERIQSFIDIATEHLNRENVHFFQEAFPTGETWRLYENFRETACFFDIETTGLSHRHDDVTTVTFYQGDETTTLVRGDDLTERRVRDQFRNADLLVTFNGKQFDVPFLERSFGLDVTAPHLDLMYTCRKVGLTGGLKPIEADLGIDRDAPELTGRDAVRLWREYQRGDERALETLIRYNRDDTRNLQILAEEVTSRLHQRTFPE